MASEPETLCMERAAKRQRRDPRTQHGQHTSEAPGGSQTYGQPATNQDATSQSVDLQISKLQPDLATSAVQITSGTIKETAQTTAAGSEVNGIELLVAATVTLKPMLTAAQQARLTVPDTVALSNDEIQKGMQLVQQMLGGSTGNIRTNQQHLQARPALQHQATDASVHQDDTTEQSRGQDMGNACPDTTENDLHQAGVSMGASVAAGSADVGGTSNQPTHVAILHGFNNPASLTALISSLNGLASSLSGPNAISNTAETSTAAPADKDSVNTHPTETTANAVPSSDAVRTLVNEQAHVVLAMQPSQQSEQGVSDNVAQTGNVAHTGSAGDAGVAELGNNSLLSHTAWTQLLPQLTALGASHSSGVINLSLEALIQQVMSQYRGSEVLPTSSINPTSFQLTWPSKAVEPGPIIPRSIEGTKLGDGRIYMPLPMVSKYFSDAEFPLHMFADVYVNNEVLQQAHPVKIARSINKTRKHGLGNHWVTGHQRLVRHLKDVRLLGMDAILASEEETASGLHFRLAIFLSSSGTWDPAYKLLPPLPPPSSLPSPAVATAANLEMLPTLASFTTNPLAATLQSLAGNMANTSPITPSVTTTSRPAEMQPPIGQQRSQGTGAQSAALQALQQLLTASQTQMNSSSRPAAGLASESINTAVAACAQISSSTTAMNDVKAGTCEAPTEQQASEKETTASAAHTLSDNTATITTASTLPTQAEIPTACTGPVNRPCSSQPDQGVAVSAREGTQVLDKGQVETVSNSLHVIARGKQQTTNSGDQGHVKAQQQGQGLAGVTTLHSQLPVTASTSDAVVDHSVQQEATSTQPVLTTLKSAGTSIQLPLQPPIPQNAPVEQSARPVTQAVDLDLGSAVNASGLQPSQLSNNQLLAALLAQLQHSASSETASQPTDMLALLGVHANVLSSNNDRSALNGSVENGISGGAQGTQAVCTNDPHSVIANTIQGTAEPIQVSNVINASTSAAGQLDTSTVGTVANTTSYDSTGMPQIVSQPLVNSDALQRLLSNQETSALANGLTSLLNLAALLGLAQSPEALQRNSNLAKLYDGRIHVPLAIVTSHFATAEFPVTVQARVFINGTCIDDNLLQARIVKYRKHKRPNHFNYWITGLQKVLARYNDVRQQGVRMEDGALRVDLVAADE